MSKTPIDYNEKMREAFRLMGDDEPADDAALFETLNRAAPIWDEITTYVQDVPLYIKSKDKEAAFIAELEAEHSTTEARLKHIWYHFLFKITSAPVRLMVTGTVIMCIPILHKYLQQYNTEKD